MVCVCVSEFSSIYFSYVLVSSEKSHPQSQSLCVLVCRKQSSQRNRFKPQRGVAGEGEGAATAQE